MRPYSWIAQEIGSPRASRAVGTALAGNPVPVLIPCHRVVRGDGVIGNYIFGTDVKRSLLTEERANIDRLEVLGKQGIRFVGSENVGTPGTVSQWQKGEFEVVWPKAVQTAPLMTAKPNWV